MTEPLNIHIRHAEPTDAEALWKCFTAPIAARNTLQLPYQSVEAVRTRLKNHIEEGGYHLVAVLKDEVIGSIGIHPNRRPRTAHIASIGMMVRDDWQGKGVGTALMQAAMDFADQWLNVSRVELSVFVDNAPAIALYQKFGFEIEGTMRKAAFREGAFVDVLMMARLK